MDLFNCDYLSDVDIEALAIIIGPKLQPFKEVREITHKGTRLARALSKFAKPEHPWILLVNDVLTSDKSMNEAKEKIEAPVIGLVIFARTTPPRWISSVFTLSEYFRQ